MNIKERIVLVKKKIDQKIVKLIDFFWQHIKTDIIMGDQNLRRMIFAEKYTIIFCI